MSGPETPPPAAPVLLVEDNPDDEILLREAYRRARVAAPLDVVRSVDAAVARARAHPRPLLVLLDLKLAPGSGAEVVARVRGETRRTGMPLVVLGGATGTQQLAACYEAGANSVVLKPDDFATLERLVADLLAYWLRVNEAAPAP